MGSVLLLSRRLHLRMSYRTCRPRREIRQAQINGSGGVFSEHRLTFRTQGMARHLREHQEDQLSYARRPQGSARSRVRRDG